MTTIEFFRDEYLAHVNDQRCPAGVCKDLITYSIISDECTGCRSCARQCPQECISGEKKKPHIIDTDECIRCGICMETCKFDAVKVI
jgi:NAD-dependent dihydropyrimidine dehydrogenase PreA subunit